MVQGGVKKPKSPSQKNALGVRKNAPKHSQSVAKLNKKLTSAAIATVEAEAAGRVRSCHEKLFIVKPAAGAKKAKADKKKKKK
ncbi:hypothetical protein PAPYR_3144 [Paratrimastix pyriformis]|uniref:Uncharacterized protein n=1 Tax=Paratrimastix pyriformis TaxID=342808 RepID=A0ABQ8UMX9_9EUKA|nr:hypothetical protein PAPYR_3144 [Paratrimastix pyriformis]